ncbi:MAG: hypothetical protein HQM02_02980, partial [Magnetococcales bacterium]|nr:hypothetical protein [Magnetococcales bacterium]
MFLQRAATGAVLPTVLSLLPSPVGGRAYAQSEKHLSAEWLELAARYGKPTGKFGNIGDPVTLTIGYQPYCTPYWTATINKQAQICAKYLPKGSRIIWFRALSGPLISNNMNAGTNQIGYMAETPALTAGDLVNCDLVSVTGYDLGETGSIVVRKDLLEGDKVKQPRDLNQRPIGVPFGSYSHRQILTWSRQNGVGGELSEQSIERQMSNINSSAIWAGALWEPYPSWLEFKGAASRWVTGLEMPCSCDKYHPQAVKHTFRVTGATLAIHDWLRERPDIIAAYLKSEEECRELLTSDPELATYLIWSDISEVPPAVVRNALDMMVWDGRLTPEINRHLKGCARMWREAGFLKNDRSRDPDAYVDRWANGAFLELALKELQKEGRWSSLRQPGFPHPVRPDQNQRHDWKKYQEIQVAFKEWN